MEWYEGNRTRIERFVQSSSSPGHPKYQRPVELGFWLLLAQGLLAEDAAEHIGVAPTVTTRWFRNADDKLPDAVAHLEAARADILARSHIALVPDTGAEEVTATVFELTA